MLEISYGLTFFLKSPKRKSDLFRYVYVRITVDGVPKETSTKRKWDMRRWDQNLERAIGTKEDARSLNFFLDSLELKVGNFKTELVNTGKTITAARIIEFIKGHEPSKAKVLEEFQKHNDEMQALVPEEYSKGTHTRYVTARSHVEEFIKFKYKKEDLEFRELNYEFITDYEFYLKTVRECANNTALKYISNFKKIVLRAIAKEIIPNDPFKLFKGKKTKIKKKPLTKGELQLLENKDFSSDRLSTIRDIFVFQCYTGLAYIDAYQLKKTDIKEGNDGRLWIMSSRQKSKSNTDIPLLPKALEIMNKYKDNALCISRGSILPVKSNQKMNEYLKEIATLCGINTSLNTHKARRTFASTITLNNGVPINVVKEMLGHHSVKQTEDYAITEQETISREMIELKERLSGSETSQIENDGDIARLLNHLNREFESLKLAQQTGEQNAFKKKLAQLEASFNKFKAGISS
ncbi:site-specific integrase [Chryseobacterium sp. CKR4-1]|uniref:site-specific integrase n=1 Tax=Chryseobacterium sp. CKR4-1 TaxID=3068896 RepID=UPI002796786C|nr:site-specific integrase [Chryseobacterium sp. CKR4-1]MDQ1803048.1 site-specific integrase [Chryseobacterium sp. CKR4-1]